MKNRRVPHDFHVSGGYDPQQDGGDPRYGRIEVTCGICGEARRIYNEIAEVNSHGGCVRSGPAEPWERGDLLIREEADGRFNDQFVGVLPNGRVVTWNGSYYESDISQLTPKK